MDLQSGSDRMKTAKRYYKIFGICKLTGTECTGDSDCRKCSFPIVNGINNLKETELRE